MAGINTPSLLLGAGGITVLTNSDTTLGSSLPITLSADQIWANSGAGTLFVNGPVTYSNKLTLSSGSVKFQTSSNTGVGGLRINGATVSTTQAAFAGTGILQLSSGSLAPGSSSLSIANVLNIDGSFSLNPGTSSAHLTFTGGGTIGGTPTITFNDTVGPGTTFSTGGLTFSSPTTFTGAGTATFNSNLTTGANLLTFAGSGTKSINNTAVISSTGGITKTGSGTLNINGGVTNTNSIGTSTLTINGGIVQLDAIAGGAGNVLNSTANVSLGGGALLYRYANNNSQSFTNLTLTPGESVAYANRNGSFNTSLTFTGTVTRNIGSTLTVRTLDTSRGTTTFSGLPTGLVTSNGTAYLTTGNLYSGTQVDNFNDWGSLDASKRVTAAAYTTTTATVLGTSTQNANVGGVATTTLAANTTTASFRNNTNQATTIDLNGKTWQTGGILVAQAVATAGSIIKDTPGTGSLTGPASSDLTIFVSPNVAAPQPFTISAKIIDNVSTAITKGASGTLILSGNNTFTGGLFINDGTVQLGSLGALNSTTANAVNFAGSGMIAGVGNTSPGSLASAPTLALGGFNTTVKSISAANNQSGSTPVIQNANGSSVANAVLTVNGTSSTTFTGALQNGTGGGTLGLTKTGASTLTLAGTNTYSGTTTVSGASSVLTAVSNINASSAISVGSGATLNLSTPGLTRGSSQTLSGAGIVSGAVSLGAGALLTPGDGGAFGTLSLGSLTMATGSSATFQYGGGNSLVTTSGLLNFSGATSINFLAGGNTLFGNANSGQTYNLFNYGSLSGDVTTLLSWVNAPNGLTAAFSAVGNNVQAVISGSVLTISNWNIATGGTWNSAGNWDAGGIPDGTSATAVFGSAIGAPASVALDGNRTAGIVNFNNSNFGYTINPGAPGGSTLILDNGANPAQLNNNGGAHGINAAVNLTGNVSVNVPNSGDTLTLAGAVANTGASKVLTKTGLGTLVLGSANSYGPAAGTVGTNFNAGTIRVNDSAALGAGDVSVAGGVTLKSGAAGLNLANNVKIGSALVATVDTAGNVLTLSGIVSDITTGGAMTVASSSGNGILILTGANTYTGGTLINSGTTLQVGNNGATGSLPSTGGITNNGSLVFQRADAVTIILGSAISSGGTLTQNGGVGNILQLNGASTYTGGTTITAGTIQLGTNGAIGTGSVSVATGATLDMNGKSPSVGALTGAGILNSTAAGTITLSIGGNGTGGTFSGTILNTLGNVSLVKNGSGTQFLTGANSYSGSTTVNGGVLNIGAGGVINGTSASVNAVAGTQLVVSGGSLTSSGFSTIQNTGSGFLLTSGSASFNGGLQGSDNDGSVIRVDGGTFSASSVTLRRTQSYLTLPGSATINNGFYSTGGVSTIGTLTIGTSNSSASARVDGGAVTVTGQVGIGDVGGGRYSVLQVNGGTFTSSNATTGIILSVNTVNSNNSELLLTGGLTTAERIAFGTATAVAGGTGTLAVNGGTLYVGSGGILVPAGSSVTPTINLTAGTIGAAADWSSTLAMQVNGSGFTIKAADAADVLHNISLGGALTGAGALTKTGTGSLTLSATNSVASLITRSGETVISGSTTATSFVSVGSVNGDSGTLTVQTGGALTATAGAGDINVGDNNGSTGILNLTGGSITSTNLSIGKNFNSGAGTTTGTVNQSGSSTFTVNGSNGVILANNIGGVGTYNLNGGSLVTKKVSQGAGASGTINFNGGTLQAGGANATFMTGLTAANVQAGGALINDGGFAVTIGQALVHDPALGATPDGGLTKSGIGTLALTGTSTYTGATTINAGTLAVNGSITSSVTVNSGATLSGSGTITGDIAVASNGFLAAGNSPGVLTASGTTTLASSSIFSWDLDTTLSGRGTAYDGVNTSAVSGSGAIFQVVLQGAQSFGDAFWTSAHTWSDIFTTNGTTPVSSDLAAVFSAFTYANGSGVLGTPSAIGSFSITGSTLSWSAVPEPTSALAGLLLSAGLLRRRRTSVAVR